MTKSRILFYSTLKILKMLNMIKFSGVFSEIYHMMI